MKFLEEIAEVILDRYADDTDDVTLVFPNRRAGLFFRKYLAARITKPVWSPKITSIEDFIKDLSNLKSADKLDLIFELYKVFIKLNKSKEVFDKFFYWGNILLHDFDELDKFLVDAELLFKNLVHIKNLENNLEYLQEDQKQLIKEFWQSFGEKLSSHQKGFLGIWDNLFETYRQFKINLSEKGTAYDGMIYREVAESLENGQIESGYRNVIFAGFNALSKSEETIISWFVKEGKGEVYWDADDYYLNDNKQEAGRYLREMKFGNSVLRNSFRESYGNNFEGSTKKIEVISVASDVGQAQIASEILKSGHTYFDENTAVVMPNNELLFPLLHALPPEVEKLNITMGYPLSSSTIYGLLDALIDLQLKAAGKSVFYFRSVLTVLNHPLLARNKDEIIDKLARDIIQKNTIWIPRKKLELEHDVLHLIFGDSLGNLSTYLMEIIMFLARQIDDEVEREFLIHFYKLINNLHEFIRNNKIKISMAAYQKLFRQLVQGERLPFEGEPLLGLQVMGILETRNLDFENIIVLSMNEDLIPPSAKNTSFIPYSIRKVFELPVVDHQDAMYSYIFYRLVQRAKNIYFVYNSTEGTGKSGEVSRFVRQLEYETDLSISHKTISTDVTVEDPHVISISKNEGILENLYRFTSKKESKKRFTPTALNTYLDCRLRFYFKYVLELYELDEISEEVDPMVFGNILHHVMEQLYMPHDRDGKRVVSESDIKKLEECVNGEIMLAFAKHFGAEGKEFVFEGQNILAKEIIRKMVLKVLEYDKQRTPFEILGVEADDKKGYVLNSEIEIGDTIVQVGMKGIIDRIEQKGEVIRIVDYKTGQDALSFPDVISLFDRESKSRNKAVFQTFFYALLFLESPNGHASLPVQASLFNIRELFDVNFSPLIQKKNGRISEEIFDIRPYLDEFKAELNKLLSEIFSPEIPFSQTEDTNKCRYCPYSGICNR
jgi:hypothetical protein